VRSDPHGALRGALCGVGALLYDDPVRPDIRSARPDDVAGVLAFWEDATTATSTDTAASLLALIEHDAGALIVAEEAGQVVGTVIAGWDGWRGSVYRLAVAPVQRRRGLATQLLRAAEDRLARSGASRAHAIVVGSDARAVAFWEASGWTYEQEQRRYTTEVHLGDAGGGPGPP